MITLHPVVPAMEFFRSIELLEFAMKILNLLTHTARLLFCIYGILR